MSLRCNHCCGLIIERYDHELRGIERVCLNCGRYADHHPTFVDGRALVQGLLCVDCGKEPRCVIRDNEGRVHYGLELARCASCRIKAVEKHRARQLKKRKSQNPSAKMGNIRARKIMLDIDY